MEPQSEAPVWKTQYPAGQVAFGGVDAMVPVETPAVASPVLVSTWIVPRLVLPDSVSVVPVVEADWNESVATVLPLESCTKHPKATFCAAMVTDTLPEESAVLDAATGGDWNVTQ